MGYYQGIADYYDLLMDAGYYDYESLATSIRSAIGSRKRLLELGIGTGQVAQALLKLDPTYDYVGIDFSPAMIEIANKRLSNSIPIVECDVAKMNLDRKFDAAISSGGTWVIVRSNNELQLGTHLFNQENDILGLQNVAKHLDSGGLLLLSVHSPHEDRDLNLTDGIVYSQKIGKPNGSSEHFFVEKTYSFHKEGSVLAEETLALGFYKDTAFQKILADVGFKPLEMTDDRKFFVFEKVD
ncbi:class I SAM-dependent methyltransferase [Oscillatoriales cyanobacterium LEGE 11467]|uniref:Class I SAM-dependent methyltransferase n=1 Tax=Zarconia navalis LEGE 11467 TaxID=1828826 RepID=A0A928W3T6_9CYAN|nr:class I SAM-dependent methyltransferase [Zarconia navalis]MBE9042740.1 class I SAM-dependent methyltransferase [Zarconia navalis LEGE 11467]